MEHIKRDRTLMKGSITVEASFVVGLTLMVIFVTLSIYFYIYNQAWYSAATGETAITASTYAVRKNGEYHEIIATKRQAFDKGAGFLNSCPGIFSNSDDEQIEIGANVTVPILMSNRLFRTNAKNNSKVIKPVRFIRKIQALKIVKEQIDGS